MSANPTPSAVDLLRFLTLSLAVHADAMCCAVDDVEAALVESSTNDELLEALENELVVLLDTQRRLHAGRAIIALSQDERRRGQELRRGSHQLAPSFGGKRIQTSRTPSRKSGSRMRGTVFDTGERPSANMFPAETDQTDDATVASTRGLSPAPSLTAAQKGPDADSIDVQVADLKAKILHLDRYSLRSKLLELKKKKRAVKEIDLDHLVAKVVDPFEFPVSVRALWSSSEKPAASQRCVHPENMTLSQHATGKGDVVSHKSIDVLLMRACERLSGRAADALGALSSTNVSDESAAAHLLGCMVYANEFDSSEGTDLTAVQQLQAMPRDTLSRFYADCLHNSVCEMQVDDRCVRARGTVLAARDFIALPTDWTTTQSLSAVPFDEVLPPAQHSLAPRFSFADVAELKQLQAKRVELQEKIVRSLLDEQEKQAELVQGIPGSEKDRMAATARLVVSQLNPASTSAHTWKTLLKPHSHLR